MDFESYLYEKYPDLSGTIIDMVLYEFSEKPTNKELVDYFNFLREAGDSLPMEGKYKLSTKQGRKHFYLTEDIYSYLDSFYLPELDDPDTPFPSSEEWFELVLYNEQENIPMHL